MGFFDFFKRPDINAGMEQFKNTKGAVLIDVRTDMEYSQGHIPGSINIELQNINRAKNIIKEKNTPLFVYCLSGARSSRASSALRSMGYTDVNDIGGINRYNGQIGR